MQQCAFVYVTDFWRLRIMNKIQQAIFNSVERALSQFNWVNKEEFYRLLQQKCKVKPDNIHEQYDKVHQLLADMYGVRHFEIEREIVRTLHQSSETGEYKEVNEIPAFAVIVESYFRETRKAMAKSQAEIEKSRQKLDEITAKQAKMERKNTRKT